MSMRKILLMPLIALISCTSSYASELRHSFNSPAFNGQGYSSHVLTIENLTFQRKKDIEADEESKIKEAQRADQNTNINKFLANFESRVYAELSKQLSEKLFGETASDSGTIEIMGNTIEYSSDGSVVTMIVTDSNGSTTTLAIPLSGFGF